MRQQVRPFEVRWGVNNIHATMVLCAGEVGRGPQYKERYHATLETREHNHLRVCRILACFSVLGFRRYKEPLVRFLESEAGYERDAPMRRKDGDRALSLTPYAINMFRTYIREDTPEYLEYSGVKPGDETDHVLFTTPGALSEAPKRPEGTTQA